jgi:hypothetical protein
MTHLAPMPESSRKTQIAHGYELCARCGEILVEGETAIATARLPSWQIYTHDVGPSCPARVVRGWLAVRRAESVARTNNVETVRESEPYHLGDALRPSVCILDDRHIEAALSVVDYWPSSEAVARKTDVSVLLSSFCFRSGGGGKRTVISSDQDSGAGRGGGRQFLLRNHIEEALISAIDGDALDTSLRHFRECLQACRRESFATFRIVSDDRSVRLGFVGRTKEVTSLRAYTIPRRAKKVSCALTHDISGRPVELPFYSNVKTHVDRRKRVSEFDRWLPKPRAVHLPFSSATHPEFYNWEPNSRRHSELIDSRNPFGPVAVLAPEKVHLLNLQRKDRFRFENIKWEEKKEVALTSKQCEAVQRSIGA